MAEPFRIVPFDPARHQEGVLSLILNIQRGEFGLPITAQDQPDLLDIPGFYLNGSHGPGCFFVAEDADGNVAGSIALKNIGPGADGADGSDGVGQGALRKMFVRKDMRGKAPGMSSGGNLAGGTLAGSLLATLEAWCAEHGVGRLYLGTTERFLAAHRFYEKHGFTPIAKADLPSSFPVMAVDSVFYAKRIP